jgi:hypothetical protein
LLSLNIEAIEIESGRRIAMRLWQVMTLVAPLAAALGVAPEPAYAQRGAGPCREDIEKFCASVQPGGGRFRDCLQQHAAEVTPACQQHLSQMKAKVAAWRQACEGDAQKLCSGVAPGHGNVVRCLHQHQNDLSPACKDELAQRPRRHGPAPAPGQ